MTDELVRAWHGASWREVEPERPTPVRATVTGLIQQRVLASCADGQWRTVRQVARAANLEEAQASSACSRLMAMGVMHAADHGGRFMGHRRRQYRVALHPLEANLRAAVLEAIVSGGRQTLREITAATGLRMTQVDHAVRVLFDLEVLARAQRPWPDGKSHGVEPFEYWSR